jgi:hypothetical protein
MACLFVASLAAGIARVSGLMIAAGGATAMSLVLLHGGPGTIFPIVLTAGAVLIAAATLLGAWLGSEIGRWLVPHGP